MQNDKSPWLYFKLYPGPYLASLDYAIVSGLVPPALENRICKWHFLRMTDHGGVHLRVRYLAGSPGEADELAPNAERHLLQIAADLPHCPTSSFSPLVGSMPPPLTADMVGGYRVERASYEPEHEKYGYGELLSSCESHFCTSSEIAVSVITAELFDGRSRKFIAPLLLARGIDAFGLPRPPQQFLQDYSEFWGQNSLDFGVLKTRFDGRIAALKVNDFNPLNAEVELQSDEQVLLARWEETMRQMSQSAQRHMTKSRSFADQLVFNLCHLVMNRAGFPALDESYLARLVAAFRADAA